MALDFEELHLTEEHGPAALSERDVRPQQPATGIAVTDMSAGDENVVLQPPARVAFVAAAPPRPVLPHWAAEAVRTLNEFLTLPPDWDSYGGRPTSPLAAMWAFRAMGAVQLDESPCPDIVPLASGGITLSWRHNGARVELDIVPGRLGVMVEGLGEPQDYEGPLAGHEPEALEAIRVILSTLSS